MTNNEAMLIAYVKGYRVTHIGCVYSPTGNKLKLRPYGKGNNRLVFSVALPDGTKRKIPVHRLQAFQKFSSEMFYDGIEVRHLDNDSQNNNWSNIGIGTASENAMDIPKEERIHKASLANRKYPINEILCNVRNGMPYSTISRMYGISKSTISYHVNK